MDGGAIKQTFPSGIVNLENGVEHVWGDHLDPIPSDAKELTFTILSLGGSHEGQANYDGPWVFKIPLQ